MCATLLAVIFLSLISLYSQLTLAPNMMDYYWFQMCHVLFHKHAFVCNEPAWMPFALFCVWQTPSGKLLAHLLQPSWNAISSGKPSQSSKLQLLCVLPAWPPPTIHISLSTLLGFDLNRLLAFPSHRVTFGCSSVCEGGENTGKPLNFLSEQVSIHWSKG